MKKFLIILALLAISATSANAAAWKNDLRTLFQNGNANIYVINIRTFSASDTNHNEIIEIEKGETPGTFTGAAKRLDNLASHGINTIHLLPITPVGKLKALGTAGSLYAMDDFSTLNPQLDDKSNFYTVFEEAKMFIEEAHKRNIRVIVDLPSCGSYDMFLRRPELFASGKDGKDITPADWTDVRLFKTKEADGSINEELFDAHKSFVDLVQRLGADGIRADVATIKPYEFWQMLINYARRNDPQFLFVAEASPEWTEPAAKEADFTPYDKLVSAGFDGYLGNFMNYPKFTSAQELFTAHEEAKKLGERYGAAKSIILNFATHDDISPMLVNSNYASQLLWLSATLPGNSYFVNGFMTGDFYTYSYANKKADVTYTDDQYYYVHKGKLDIFNYSRRPGSVNKLLADEFSVASNLKFAFGHLYKNGPEILKTSNKDIFAYEYHDNNQKLIVILNHNQTLEVSGTVAYKGVEDFSMLMPLRAFKGNISYDKGKFDVRLAPSDIAVFVFTTQYSQNQ